MDLRTMFVMPRGVSAQESHKAQHRPFPLTSKPPSLLPPESSSLQMLPQLHGKKMEAVALQLQTRTWPGHTLANSSDLAGGL